MLAGWALWLALQVGPTPTAFVTAEPTALPERYWATWRRGVAHLLQPDEAEIFDSLSNDGDRLAFADRFWQARDPTPETFRNEARDRFFQLQALARQAYPQRGDPRAEAILRLGWPIYRQPFGDCGDPDPRVPDQTTYGVPEIPRARCTLPLMDLMFFSGGSPGAEPLTLTFHRRAGECRRLRPGEPLLEGESSNERVLAALERQHCFEAYPALRPYLERALLEIPSDQRLESVAQRVPLSLAADAGAADAVESDVELQLAWGPSISRRLQDPLTGGAGARVRLRQVTGVLDLAATSLEWPEDVPWVTLSLALELLDLDRGTTTWRNLDRRLFPSDGERLEVPFIFEVRPGRHQLVARLQTDVGHFRPLAFALDVPDSVEEAHEPSGAGADLLAVLEASPRVRLSDDLAGQVTGVIDVEVVTRGPVSAVAYRLDGREVATASEPSFRAAIDFGVSPLTRSLEVVALGEGGRVLARDQMIVNPGAQRFEAQILDAVVLGEGSGRRLAVRPRVQISVPYARSVDRVELFVGDRALGTLYQPPWALWVEIDPSERPAVVRAVVHLDDGRSRESAALVTDVESPRQVAESMQVDLVEVFASVTGRRGRPVEDLTLDEFSLREEREPRTLREVRRVRDLPINVLLLLDTSSSVAVNGELVKAAAAEFLDSVVSEKDRAALVQFDTTSRVVVPLTGDRERLRQSVDAIWMGGGTAFRDALVTGLYYLSGARGRRAVVVLSDGLDEHSILSQKETLQFAQRAGIAVYTVGLGLQVSSSINRPLGPRATSLYMTLLASANALASLARGSGGLSFVAADPDDLPEIYRQIEADLRSQYLLSFQSPLQGDDFRRLEVGVNRRGTKVRAAAGYFP